MGQDSPLQRARISWTRRLLPLVSFSFALASVLACQRPISVSPPHEGDLAEAPPVEPARAPWASARTLDDATELPFGRFPGAKPGDLVIENEHAVFLIAADDGRPASGRRAGSVIGAARRASADEPEPAPGTPPRHETTAARYESLEITKVGGEELLARVRALGKDSNRPEVVIETEYSLAPDTAALLIRTTVTNESDDPLEGRTLGDTIHWGSARPWRPGLGFGQSEDGYDGSPPWLAGVTEDSAYVYASPVPLQGVEEGPGWSRTTVERAVLRSGEPTSFERALMVGRDAATALESVLELFGAPAGVLTGVFREIRTEEALAKGRLEIRDSGGRPFVRARAGPDGTFRFLLPPGEWIVVSDEPGRGTAMAGRARLTAGGRGDAVVEATGPASIEVLVVEQREDPEAPDVLHSFPVPSKLRLTGVDGTTTPVFGPPHDHRGAANVVFAAEGRATLPLAPGRYAIRASRGPEYEIDEREVDVLPGDAATLDLSLRRTVDSSGWLSADLRRHTSAHPSSMVSPEALLVASAAEGLDIVIVGDRDVITDLAPEMSRLELEHWLAWFPGVLFEGEEGHALEVMSGSRPHDTEAVMRDWFGLLNAGRRYTGTGSSGSTDLVRPPGDAPRTYLRVNVEHPRELGEEELSRAVAEGRAVITRGPFPSLTARLGTEAKESSPAMGDPRADGEAAASGEVVEVGGRLRPSGGAKVVFTVGVQAPSWVDVSRFSLVRDGEEAVSIELAREPGEPLRHRSEHTIDFDRSGWVLLMIEGSDPAAGEAESSAILALTNPIWIEIDEG